MIPDVHAGYVTWAQFEANQKRLAENALGFEEREKGDRHAKVQHSCKAASYAASAESE